MDLPMPRVNRTPAPGNRRRPCATASTPAPLRPRRCRTCARALRRLAARASRHRAWSRVFATSASTSRCVSASRCCRTSRLSSGARRRPAIRGPMRVAERAAVPTRPTLVAEIALRPSSAPRIELPMVTAVCIFCCESCACSRSRRSSARRIWSASCSSLACQFLRSSATAASRFSRAASARRARKSPSDSPGFDASLKRVAYRTRCARGLVEMRLQGLRPGRSNWRRAARCRAISANSAPSGAARS